MLDGSPHGGHQMETPTADVVQTGVLESDAGQHHAQQRRQTAHLGDELTGHGACHVQHKYGRQTAAGYGHQLRRHVHVQQRPRDGHGQDRGRGVGQGGRNPVVATARGSRSTVDVADACSTGVRELHAGVVLIAMQFRVAVPVAHRAVPSASSILLSCVGIEIALYLCGGTNKKP